MEAEGATHTRKRRRIPLACQQCRTRKVKCDYGNSTQCARCIKYNLVCSGKLEVKKGELLIDVLQQKAQQMESILGRFNTTREHVNSGTSTKSNELALADGSKSRTPPFSLFSLSPKGSLSTRPPNCENVSSCFDAGLYEDIKYLSLGDVHRGRPAGQSSDLAFLEKALEIRQSTRRRTKGLILPSYQTTQILPWELDSLKDESTTRSYSFPEPDLLHDLIDLYFRYVNIGFWLLHRPSFNLLVSSELHLRDHHFAEVLLLVAAIGARYSDDPRVYAHDAKHKWRSSGWRWFSQIQLFPKALIRVSSLYELQKICLACCYLAIHITPQVLWSIVGIGLRLAQEQGIHYRKKQGYVWTIEDELWKRAFWTLLCLDRLSCSALGRPCSTQEEDFDLELPAICDDEYWETIDPNQSFQQPEGRPSEHAFFSVFIRLTDILAFTLRTVYAVSKFKSSLYKSNPRWQEEAVQAIDSALNRWYDSVPTHLQWPISSAGTTFYYQSVALQLTYHHIRMQAHRPFIPSLIGRSASSLASLAMCANAARSCSHIFATLIKTPPVPIMPYSAPVTLSSSLSLLLYIWESEKFGIPIDSSQELQNIRLCRDYLREFQSRSSMAGQFAELLDGFLLQEEQLRSLPRDPVPPNPNISEMPVPGPPGSSTQQAMAWFPQLPQDPADIFSTFMDDVSVEEGYDANWGFNDLTMLHNLSTEDEFYRELFASFCDDGAAPSRG